MKVSDMDELVFLWKDYAKVHDKRLTKDAQDLKQQVRGFVQSLPTFHEKAKHMKEAPEKRLECFGTANMSDACSQCVDNESCVEETMKKAKP